MENLIAAAGRNGARLVVLDNVYMLGRPQGKPLDEDTPPRPCSRNERSGRASPNECGKHIGAAMFGRRAGARRTSTDREGR
jgi:hypothetical protein